MTDDLQQYVKTANQIGSENWIGRLAWYTVSDLSMPHNAVIAALVGAGISSNLPLYPEDADVFKRVCSKVKRTKVPTSDPEILNNFLMREFRDDKTVTRRLVMEKVDHRGRKLGYTELVDIIFDRANSVINVTQIGGAPLPTAAREMTQEALEGFAKWQGCLNSYAVREWIRAYLLRLGATRVRPGGGVYFLREEYAPQIAALEDFTSRLNGECEFHSLPLIDDRKQRDMIARAFEAEVTTDVDDIMGEMAKIIGEGKKITGDRYARYVTDYQGIVKKADGYSDLLEQKLDSTNARLSVFQKQLLELRLCVKEEG